MLHPTKTAQVLQILVAAKKRGDSCVGMDKSQIHNPVELIQKAMGYARNTALGYLKELELQGAVTVVKEGVGGRVESATIRKEALDTVSHELDEDERVRRALYKYRRSSQLHPGTQIVFAHDFDLVRRDAGVGQTMFYVVLARLAADGFLDIVRKERNDMILYVILLKGAR